MVIFEKFDINQQYASANRIKVGNNIYVREEYADQQLAEKDKEIERLNDRLDKYISGRLKSMIAEKDEEIEELKEQLAEKDKEINSLGNKPIIETNREMGTMKIDGIEFTEEQVKRLNHFLEVFQKKIREDVCEEIKDWINTCCRWDEVGHIKDLYWGDLNKGLDKIERGE